MVLPVLKRIHCGIGRFCFCALASFCLVRKDLWLYYRKYHQHHSSFQNPKTPKPNPSISSYYSLSIIFIIAVVVIALCEGGIATYRHRDVCRGVEIFLRREPNQNPEVEARSWKIRRPHCATRDSLQKGGCRGRLPDADGLNKWWSELCMETVSDLEGGERDGSFWFQSRNLQSPRSHENESDTRFTIFITKIRFLFGGGF